MVDGGPVEIQETVKWATPNRLAASDFIPFQGKQYQRQQ